MTRGSIPSSDVPRAAEENEFLGRWCAARERHEQALRDGLPGCDPTSIARQARRIARCLVEEAELDAALDTLVFARAVSTVGGDSAGIAHTVNLEGIIAQRRGKIDDAQALYRQARSIGWQARDVVLVAMLDQNLGTIASIRGDHAEARLRYEASLAAYRTLGLRKAVGPLLNNLGIVHTHTKRWRDAERCYALALNEAAAIGDLAGRLRTEANRAEMYLLRGRYRKAKRLSRRVLTLGLGRDRCEGSWLAEAYQHLGVAYRETGELERAEECFQQSLQLAERREDALVRAAVLRELSVARSTERRQALES